MIRSSLLASVAALSLLSCASTPTLTADSMLNRAFSSSTSQSFDVAVFLSELPDWLNVTFADSEFDRSSGAMIVNDLSVSLVEFPEYPLLISRADIWGADAQALKLVLDGGAPDAKQAIFERMALQGVRSDNWQWNVGEPNAGRIDFASEKIVIDGLSAKSFAPPTLASEEKVAILPDSDDASIASQAVADSSEEATDSEQIDMQFLLKTLAISAGVANSYSMEGAVYQNTTFKVSQKIPDSETNAEFSTFVEEQFVRNYDGGRTEYQSLKNVSYATSAPEENPVREVNFLGVEVEETQDGDSRNAEVLIFEVDDIEVPDEDYNSEFDKILQPWKREEFQSMLENPVYFLTQYAGASKTQTSIEMVVSENVDISGGLLWLSKLQMPPISETELLDLGTSVILGNQTSWNDKVVTKVDRSEILASDFYWLIPSNFRQVDTGYFINFSAIFEHSVNGLGLGENPESGSLEMQQVRAVIDAFDLDNLRGDGSFSWLWGGESGDLDTDMKVDFIDLASSSMALNMRGPSLAGWDSYINGIEENDSGLPDLIFDAFKFSLTDDQLLDRSYSFAATQSGDISADDLRQSVPSLLRLSAGQVGALNARIPAYVDALAVFLSENGTLTVSADPVEGVAISDIVEMSNANPVDLLDLLNVTVETSKSN